MTATDEGIAKLEDALEKGEPLKLRERVAAVNLAPAIIARLRAAEAERDAAKKQTAALIEVMRPFAKNGDYWAGLLHGSGHITNGNKLEDAAFEVHSILTRIEKEGSDV